MRYLALLLCASLALASGPTVLETVKPPAPDARPGSHMILVVDVSGSMAAHYSEAIRLAAEFASVASDDYMLHCVTFGSTPSVWPGGWADMPNAEKLTALKGWLALQQLSDAGHGTWAKPALDRADALAKALGKASGEAYVIVITDGILSDDPKPETPMALLQVGGLDAEALDKFGGRCQLGWYRSRSQEH